jgi:hypothetical protein
VAVIDDLVLGWQAMEEALPEYEKAEAYFKGTIDEAFCSPRIRQMIGSTGERYRFNLVKTAVTVLANRVELTAVTVPDDETASQSIEEVWDANDMDVHYQDLILKAFEYGDAYLMAWPIYDDDPTTVDDDELYAAGVELTVHSPKHCRIIYDPENERRKLFAIKRWKIRVQGETLWRADLYYPDRIEQWVTRSGTKAGAAESWDPFLADSEDPESWLLDNPYNEIPFFHHRNALPYGVPEHKDGYGCQDAVNKMLITQLTTTDSHGWPQRYALTDKGSELDSNSDTPYWPDDADADDTTGVSTRIKSPSSGLYGGPGTMLELHGKKSVGQFEAADPAVFTDPAQLYIRLMAQVTETPLHAFDPSGDTPSGESLKVAEAPLVKKAINRETMLKGPIQETWKFVLRILGLKVPRVDVRFAPAQAATGKSDWEVVQLKQAVGVPKDQTLIEAGYEADVVEGWDLSTPAPPVVTAVPAATVPVQNPQMEAPNA